MRKLALAAAFALLVAGGAEAASAKRVVVKVGDAVDVVGTQIVCQATIGRTLIKGKALIGCLKVDAKGPIPGTFAVALAVNGEVVAARVDKAREAVEVFRRRLASAGSPAEGRLVKLRIGDNFDLSGTDVGCSIVKDEGNPLVICFLKAPSGKDVRPKTYGIVISDFVAAVVYTPVARKAQLVFQRRQPG